MQYLVLFSEVFRKRRAHDFSSLITWRRESGLKVSFNSYFYTTPCETFCVKKRHRLIVLPLNKVNYKRLMGVGDGETLWSGNEY